MHSYWIQHQKIIDVNTLGYFRIHSRKIPNILSFIGAGSEILSGFLPVIPTLSIRYFVLRITVIKVMLHQFGIKQIHCFVPRTTRSFFFWKAIPADLEKYRLICSRIFNGLKNVPEYKFLLDLESLLIAEGGKDLLIVLPVARHYGGRSDDVVKCIRSMQLKFPDKKFLTFVKNYPSDGILEPKHATDLVDIAWSSNLSRTFPVEILLHVFTDQVFLISSGSSAMFAINSRKRFMFYPGTQFGSYLAQRNTNHLLKQFKISTIDIHLVLK